MAAVAWHASSSLLNCIQYIVLKEYPSFQKGQTDFWKRFVVTSCLCCYVKHFRIISFYNSVLGLVPKRFYVHVGYAKISSLGFQNMRHTIVILDIQWNP